MATPQRTVNPPLNPWFTPKKSQVPSPVKGVATPAVTWSPVPNVYNPNQFTLNQLNNPRPDLSQSPYYQAYLAKMSEIAPAYVGGGKASPSQGNSNG